MYTTLKVTERDYERMRGDEFNKQYVVLKTMGAEVCRLHVVTGSRAERDTVTQASARGLC